MKNEKKECWLCHRTLVGKQKFDLCPYCMNKAGTAGTVAGTGTVVGVIVLLLKKGGKTLIEVAKKVKL